MLLIPRRCARTPALVAAASVIPPAAHQYSRARFFSIRSCAFRSAHSGETTTRKLRNNCVKAVSHKAPPTHTAQIVCEGPLLTQTTTEANGIHADKIMIIGNRTQTNEEAVKREQGAILARFVTLN